MLVKNDQRVRFENNLKLRLQTLTFENSALMELTDADHNEFPTLKSITIKNCSKFHLFNVKSSFPRLQELKITDTIMRKFTNNVLPNLRSISIYNSELLSLLTMFSNNSLPSLKSVEFGYLFIKAFDNNTLGVEELNLTSHKIESFSLNRLMNLTELDLSYNKIKEIRIETFPSVEGLFLQGNEITDFSNQYAPRLIELDLSNNPLVSFNNNTFGRIESLNLSGCTPNTLACANIKTIKFLNVSTLCR